MMSHKLLIRSAVRAHRPADGHPAMAWRVASRLIPVWLLAPLSPATDRKLRVVVGLAPVFGLVGVRLLAVFAGFEGVPIA